MIVYLGIFILVALIGSLAGLLAGLLGIGGGLITVPALLLSFHLIGLSSPELMHVALGTSLGAMIFTSASSAWAHIKKGGVDWRFFSFLAPGVVGGAILGALTADSLPSAQLQIISGCAEWAIGLYFLFSARKEEVIAANTQPVVLFIPIGIAIGAISSIVGIGGGIITVPILVAFNVPMRSAISTSAALGFLIAFIGALSFLALGIGKETIPGSIGFLYLPGFFTIGFFSVLSAPKGAALAYTLPVELLRKIFALFLMLIGTAMILRS